MRASCANEAVYSGLHLMWCLHLRCRERPAVHPRREWLRSARWTSQRFPDPEGQYLRPSKRMCSRACLRVISRTAPCRALTGSCCARTMPLLQRRAPRLGPLGSPAAPSRDAGEALCARSSRVHPISHGNPSTLLTRPLPFRCDDCEDHSSSVQSVFERNKAGLHLPTSGVGCSTKTPSVQFWIRKAKFGGKGVAPC